MLVLTEIFSFIFFLLELMSVHLNFFFFIQAHAFCCQQYVLSVKSLILCLVYFVAGYKITLNYDYHFQQYILYQKDTVLICLRLLYLGIKVSLNVFHSLRQFQNALTCIFYYYFILLHFSAFFFPVAQEILNMTVWSHCHLFYDSK